LIRKCTERDLPQLVHLHTQDSQVHVIAVPVEADDGPPIGVILVQRRRQFTDAEIDHYRLLGLNLGDLFARAAASTTPRGGTRQAR
jgi:hypothetical protein